MQIPSEPTVPVFLDSVKSLDGFRLTRCVYYRLEYAQEPPSWGPAAPPDGVCDVAAAGGWVALAGPGGGGRFDTPDAVEDTLAALAADDAVSHELGYCWLPNEILEAAAGGAELRSGDVFRLAAPAFRLCCRHAAGRVDETAWRAGLAARPDAVAASPTETEAFRAWRRGRIDRTRTRYRSEGYEKRRLPKREVTR